MSSVSVEIMLIAAIFAVGLTLGFTVSLVSCVGFIIAANIALPVIIKLAKSSRFKTSKV